MTQTIEQQNADIITLLDRHPEGLSRGQVSDNLKFSIISKTLQRRLAALVDDKRIVRTGDKKATRYYPKCTFIETDKGHLKDTTATIFSHGSQTKLEFLDIPRHARRKMSYERDFLDSYIPNKSWLKKAYRQKARFMKKQ